MHLRPQRLVRYARGYSLVEMLIVVGIIAGLMAVATQGAKKTWAGQEIRSSAMKLASDISLASQTAVKLSKPVQIRFYKYLDETLASERNQFRGYQLIVLATAPPNSGASVVWEPLYELQRLEGNTVMMSGEQQTSRFSTLLDQPIRPSASFSPEELKLRVIYSNMEELEYTVVEFRPDGSTSLDAQANEPWCLTLVSVLHGNDAVLPLDFKTLTIAPDTGAVRVY
jgi:uncharacterized protein (TIGR02596 family)